MFAYEQCLLVLGHHPDIWYEAAQYLEQSSKLLAEKGVRDETFQTHIFCEIVKDLLSIFQRDKTWIQNSSLMLFKFFSLSGYE